MAPNKLQLGEKYILFIPYLNHNSRTVLTQMYFLGFDEDGSLMLSFDAETYEIDLILLYDKPAFFFPLTPFNRAFYFLLTGKKD